uniref:DNA mismatch repair protein n=1 Tax=Saccoglossus kowalevskii TaxID=10224 RepID=A0ABM0MRG2_SACKO|nr:PREDICTED: DNA mismatch repair protein Msh6-like [Saccoglossus kowalevskii]
MSKMNTLFSYFTKSPPASKTETSPTLGDLPNGKSKNSSPGEAANQTRGQPACKHKIGDIVWTKLDGYPWWPGLVCSHPTQNVFFKGGKIHVQFVDETKSRAWIKEKNDKENIHDIDDDDIGTRSSRKRPRKAALKVQKTKRRRIIEADSDEDNDDSEDEFKPESDVDSESDVSSGVDEDKISELDTESEPETPEKSLKRKRGSTRTPSAKPRKAEFSTPNSKSNTEQIFKTPTTVAASTKARLSMFTAPESPAPVSEDRQSFPHHSYEWLKEENRKDKKKRSMSDDNYDPSTIYVPESFLQSCTPASRQWWEVKSNNFNSVLFFKMGKFYELYHMDAEISVKELGLIFMKGQVAHCGFPEIAFGRYADTLIQRGYRVARIEQTETPDMMQERCRKLIKPTKFDKVVRRELCRISSKGTKTYSFIDGDTCNAESSYLLSVTEKPCDGLNGGESLYGVCFVDTSIGKFHIGQFQDDRHCSRLRTLIAHYTPVHVLYEKGKLLAKTQQILSQNLISALKDALHPGSEFWDSGKTLKFLAEKKYFEKENKKEDVEEEDDDVNGKDYWPVGIRQMLSEMQVKVLKRYLKKCFLEEELLSMRNFEVYKPLDDVKAVFDSKKSAIAFTTGRNRMVLDGVTLANLDVLENQTTGTTEGTLLERLDHCCTPFGKRLFKEWLCAPLCNPVSINDSKRKIEDFLAALNGFKTACKIIKLFKGRTDEFKSKLLKKTTTTAKRDSNDCGQFPDIQEELSFFDNAFDHGKAKSVGAIIPHAGVDPDYDCALEDINCTQKKLNHYLERQQQRLNCRTIVYFGTAKNRYQLEIPESVCKRVPDEFEVTSQKKGYKRYTTDDIKALFNELVDAEGRRDTALTDTMRRVFAIFDEHYKLWDRTVQCLSVLDVLLSLAQYSQCSENDMCRPQIISPTQDMQPYISIVNGSHPCISKIFTGGDFIPNDTYIGCKDTDDDENIAGQCVLVTGPNMGGKSTLMRQVGLLVIMAQLGCHVPAESCKLTPVDRVFTRLGASDRIMSGESTFYVELSETSSILQHASKHSLVLMDELGMFYCENAACMVENENEEDPSQETITFLYKFVKGSCPKSYGLELLYGFQSNLVIKKGQNKAREFEDATDRLKIFRKLANIKKLSDLQSSLQKLQEQLKI